MVQDLSYAIFSEVLCMRSLLRRSIKTVIKVTHKACDSNFKILDTYTIIFCDGSNDSITFSKKSTGRSWLHFGR
jgi:hypothetical protein